MYLKVDNLEIVNKILDNLDNYKKEFFSILENESQELSVKFQSKTPTGMSIYHGNIHTYMFKTDVNLLDNYEKISFYKNEKTILEKINLRRLKSPLHDQFITENKSIFQWFYNVMKPGSKIQPHFGVNGVASKKIPTHFRIHITVSPGDNSYFYIENLPPLKYTKHLSFGFEDGLINHWAENLSLTQERIVLILDMDKSILKEKIPLNIKI